MQVLPIGNSWGNILPYLLNDPYNPYQDIHIQTDMFTPEYVYLRTEDSVTCTGGGGKTNKKTKDIYEFRYLYLPTPPLGQDMTQGQFLSRVLNSEFSFS